MNQAIFNTVFGYKQINLSWATIAQKVDEQHGTNYAAGKDPGEALRSAYRRYRRHGKNTSLEAARVFGESIEAFGKSIMGSMTDGSVPSLSDRSRAVVGDVPLSLPAAFDSPLQLDLKPTLIIADLHCPFHDTTALQVVLQKGANLKVKQIIVAGDLFDFASVSRFSKSEVQTRLESDLELAGQVLLCLSRLAPVYVVSGNHDERLIAKLDTSLRLSRVVAMALNGRATHNTVTTSDYDYCFLGDGYVIGHLSEFSKYPGKIAASLAAKYQRHVLVGHDHLRGVNTSDGTATGKYIGASIGCMTDKNKHWYAARRLNTYADWAQGFAYADQYGFTLYNGAGDIYFQRLDGDDEYNNVYCVKAEK